MSHTSTTPAAKRRRLDTASRTLARPFHSPFKTPSKPATPRVRDEPSTRRPSLPFARSKSPATSRPPDDPTRSPSHNPPSRTKNAEIASLKAEIATLQQAVDIVTSKKDAELDVLIEKWRGVAREAVEGMFEGVKGRVDGMGGVRGMKRTRREILRGDGDGGGEDEGEDAGQEERNDEDEEFSMEMMLKTLNIDLDLIGYDTVAQRWRE